MSIYDDLYPASFRGIEFLIEDSSVKGGRKTVTHEFPNSDRRYVEDLGLLNETISITCCMPSQTYFDSRDAFKQALDQQGYGTLIHPFYGIRNVAVTSYTINETPNDLGYVKISIEFSVAQELLFPGSVDTDSLVGGQVEALFKAMRTGFFQSYEWVAKYSTHTTGAILSGINDIQSLVNTVAQTYIARSEFDAQSGSNFRSLYDSYDTNKASLIKSNVDTNADSGLDLYTETLNLINALDYVTNTGNQGLDVGNKLSQFTLSLPILPVTDGSAPKEVNKSNNQNSLVDMVLVLAFGVSCRNAVLYKIKSLDDVELIRGIIDTQYEVLLNRDNTLSDTVLQNIQQIRSNVIRFLDKQSIVAPALNEIELYGLPLTVFEYQQYGNLDIVSIDRDTGEIDSRTEDLRLLNRETNRDPAYLIGLTKLFSK